MSSETGQLRPASQTWAPHKEAFVIDPNFSPLLSHPHRRMSCMHIREERKTKKKRKKNFPTSKWQCVVDFYFLLFSSLWLSLQFQYGGQDIKQTQLGALFVVIPSVCVLSDQRSSGLTLSDDKGGGQREDDNEWSKHWKEKERRKDETSTRVMTIRESKSKQKQTEDNVKETRE